MNESVICLPIPSRYFPSVQFHLDPQAGHLFGGSLVTFCLLTQQVSQSFTAFPPASAAAADLSIFDAYAPQSAPAQTQVKPALRAARVSLFVSLLASSHSDVRTGSREVPRTGAEGKKKPRFHALHLRCFHACARHRRGARDGGLLRP